LGFEAKAASGEIKFVAEIPKNFGGNIDKPTTDPKNNLEKIIFLTYNCEQLT
jgi:hypothetical protein